MPLQVHSYMPSSRFHPQTSWAGQITPQPPQLPVFEESTQLLPQRIYPGVLQVAPHAPLVHVVVALLTAGHTLLHAPQLFTSEDKLRHWPPQNAYPALQPSLHSPAEHVAYPLAVPAQTAHVAPQ